MCRFGPMSRLSQKNTPCRYDERMTLKEDYDYTAEVLAGPADVKGLCTQGCSDFPQGRQLSTHVPPPHHTETAAQPPFYSQCLLITASQQPKNLHGGISSAKHVADSVFG
jgi:hypothetical protein